MRKLLSLLLLLFSFNVFAMDRCMTGSWYDPDFVGQGVNIEVNSDSLVVAYLYAFVEKRQTWWSMVGDRFLTMETTVLLDDEDYVSKTLDVGVAEFEVITDDVIYFQYRLLVDVDPFTNEPKLCLADYCSGEYLLKRLTQPIDCDK